MKINFKLLTAVTLMLMTTGVVNARPIALPDPAKSSTESGSFSINADNTLTLTGTPISLTTSVADSVEAIQDGSARFKGGSLSYSDGSATLNGKLARVSLGKDVNNGQVIYTLKGLVYGTLSQGGQTVDVNGDVGVTTKPAPEGTTLEQAQVDSSHLVVTTRSNINNVNPR